jgi:acyl-CoA synthetase (AMP-forming)/AMP-acid ligase II
LSAAHPSRRAIAVHGKIDLDALVDAAAARLRDAGVRPGKTVALCFPNTVEVNHQSST